MTTVSQLQVLLQQNMTPEIETLFFPSAQPHFNVTWLFQSAITMLNSGCRVRPQSHQNRHLQLLRHGRGTMMLSYPSRRRDLTSTQTWKGFETRTWLGSHCCQARCFGHVEDACTGEGLPSRANLKLCVTCHEAPSSQCPQISG
eukprot:703754-Rhodomonas_salina.3